MDAHRTLLDTNTVFDARLLGYDGPCDPREDGEGLLVTFITDPNVGPIVTLYGPDGEIALLGDAQLRLVAEAIEGARKINAQIAARAAEPEREQAAVDDFISTIRQALSSPASEAVVPVMEALKADVRATKGEGRAA